MSYEFSNPECPLPDCHLLLRHVGVCQAVHEVIELRHRVSSLERMNHSLEKNYTSVSLRLAETERQLADHIQAETTRRTEAAAILARISDALPGDGRSD